MSDQPEQPIRRVGRKDRKNKIDNRKPLFPEEEARFAPPPTLPEETFADEEITAEEESLDAAPIKPAPRIETPPEARFPPLETEAYVAVDESVPAPKPVRRRPNWLYNLLTVFFVLATVAALAYFTLLWTNPYHPLNPLPPFTPLPIIITTTPLPATVTPVPTQTELPTLAPSETFTPLAPAALAETPTVTAPAFPFVLNELDTDYAQNAAGCEWSGIAGQVVTLQGGGAVDLTVQVMSEARVMAGRAVTGSVSSYGPGGFEIQLGDAPQLAPFIIQLLGPDNTPLSAEYLVVTADQCEQNTVVVTFVQER